MQIILSGFSIDYCYVKIFALGHSVSSFCVMGISKLAPKHWTKIVIENIANSRFRSSTDGLRVCLSSRLVLVLKDTHWLAWIIHQLFYVSLCEYSILLLNLFTFLLSLILAHDRDHGFPFLSIVFTSATAVLMVYLPP